MEGNQKPFTGDHNIPKTILHFNSKLCRLENAVDEAFKLFAVDIVKIISGNNFHLRHEKCGIELWIANTLFHCAVGYTNFMDKITIVMRLLVSFL